MEKQMEYNKETYGTEEWFKKKLGFLKDDPDFRLEEALLEIGEQKVLIEAMRDNIAAKETIWGSLIRDNMELGQAIHGIADAWYSHQGIDYDAGETLEQALDRALKLVKGDITICGGS